MFVNKISVALVLATYVTECYSIYSSLSQTFNRNYVPNSYKYDEVYYIQSTDNVITGDKLRRDPISYGSIQYAPLNLKNEYEASYEETIATTRSTSPVLTTTKIDTSKSKIEPRLEINRSNYEQTRASVIHGHNIQSNKLYPAYNVVYRNDNDHTTKVSYVNPYMHHYKTEYQIEQTTIEPSNVKISNQEIFTNSPQAIQMYAMLARQLNNNPDKQNNEKVLYEKESPLIQPQLLHARPYRLHLNVARAHNTMHTPNIKGKIIKKILPSQALHKSESTHLIHSSAIETKLKAMDKYLPCSLNK